MHQSRPSMHVIDAQSWTVPTLRPSSSSPARRTGGHGRRTVRRKPVWQFPIELLIIAVTFISLMSWWVR